MSSRPKLHTAAAEGNVDEVVKLLESGEDVDEHYGDDTVQQDTDGSTPLILAAEKGHSEVVEQLISRGACLEEHKTDKWTALHIASYNGHSQVVELLVRNGANVDSPDCDMSTPLHVATLYGYVDVIKILLGAAADASKRDDRDRAPLHLACQEGFYEVARMLLSSDTCCKASAPGDVRSGATPLHKAARRGDKATTELLLCAGADPEAVDSAGLTPIDRAAQTGHNCVLRLMLSRGAPNSLSSTLQWAAAFGHCDCASALLGCMQAEEVSAALLEASLVSKAVVTQLLQVSASVRMLDAAENTGPPEAFDLNILFSGLATAGFNQERMACLQVKAEVLEAIIAAQLLYSIDWDKCKARLVGSLRDGCGNSLACADGSTEIDSDIDVVMLQDANPERKLHMASYCQCQVPESKKVKYSDGHVILSGVTSNPSKYYGKSKWKPSMDIVAADPCCCYPTIDLLEKSQHFPKPVLRKLQDEVNRRPSSCHVVSAAAPDKQGQQKRISTTFLEIIVMQSLTTVQCWFFLTLKFLVKRIISVAEPGLKTYHVKTLLFQMLDETPEEKWDLQHFRALLVETLKRLEAMLGKVRPSDKGFMRHFFLPNATLYLRGSGNAAKIRKAVRDTMDNLDERLQQFAAQLRSLDGDGRIKFNPFLILPLLKCHLALGPAPTDKMSTFYETMTVVTRCMNLLGAHHSSKLTDIREVLTLCNRIGDWALAARVSIKALAFLRFDQRATAEEELLKLLESGAVWEPSGLLLPQDCKSTGALWSRLHQKNFATKFCCRLDDNYKLLIMMNRFSCIKCNVFPMQLPNHINAFYINFNALAVYLAKCLKLKGATDESLMIMATSPDADVQELYVAFQFGQHEQTLLDRVHQHRELIGQEPALQRVLEQRFSSDSKLKVASIERTLKDLIAAHQK